MDKRGTVPWSQQVDEELYGNPSLFRENKTAELNIHLHQSFERINLMKSDENYSEDKINQSNVSSYNTKKDNLNYSTKMSSDETQKTRDKNFPMPNQSNINKKKITWASVASQPAKPNRRNNIGLKKKGPGMPPPPMIPGKNSLNVSPWDLAKNNISNESSASITKFIPSSSTDSSASPLLEDNINFAAKPNPNLNPKPLISEQQQQQQHSELNRKQNNPNPNPNNTNTNNYRKQQQQHQQQQQQPIKNTKSFSSSIEAAPSSASDGSLIQKHHHEEQNQNMQQSNVSSSYKESFHNEPSTRSHQPGTADNSECTEIVLKQLQDRNNYNPSEMDLQKAALSRFFVIKSYSEDDIHRSIKYEIWCSTDHGNKKLDEAFKERMKEGGNVMLYFSVNGSGHFCGMALMMTPVDYKSTASVWSQDKWKGKFKVKWIYVKDVPNSQLRHIRLENNENKSVTNSRDTQEIPLNQGIQMLKILHSYKHLTSIFDDFYHYEKKQEESVCKKPPAQYVNNYAHPLSSSNACHGDIMEPSNNWQHTGHFEDRDRERERERDRTMFNNRRDGGGEHSNSNMHRSSNNRRYGKPLDHQQQQQHQRKQQNNDELDKPTSYVSQNNEASKHNSFEQQHSNPSMENCGSRCS